MSTDNSNDRTDARIIAFLASMRPTRDVVYDAETEGANQRGWGLIRQMAASAQGTERPSLRLTVAQVADVLSFLHCSEPVDRATWWADADISHVCGWIFVMETLERSLRESLNGKV